jgi:hypothetical protein
MSFTAIVTTERGGGPSRDGVVEHVVELPVLAADGFGESGGGVVVGEGASPPPSPSEREGGSLGLTLLDLDAARESGSVDAPRTPRVVPPRVADARGGGVPEEPAEEPSRVLREERRERRRVVRRLGRESRPDTFV